MLARILGPGSLPSLRLGLLLEVPTPCGLMVTVLVTWASTKQRTRDSPGFCFKSHTGSRGKETQKALLLLEGGLRAVAQRQGGGEGNIRK